MAKVVLMDTDEVMERLGCSQRYAIQLMHSWGWHGVVYRIGRRLKVDKKFFESWLEGQKMEAGQ